MMRRKRITPYACIVIGVLIPLAFLPFVTGYNPAGGWFDNLMHIYVRLGPVNVQYRFPLALGIFLIFAGIWLRDVARHREGEADPTSQTHGEADGPSEPRR